MTTLSAIDLRQRYNIPEACALLRISRAHLYKRIASGDIPILKDGKRSFIAGSTLVDYIERSPMLTPCGRRPSE